ncbi:hypothetical protein FC85_GL001797 [Lentilactobacillus diolivorans DSM 14421]|jgi:hypothetical protein|uniref:Uncharacterized protein n=1 Tax=Lentilactobacillus diolivorans DSM 14421 TaxID=1423739 RepID=A0A0R1S313_9LACO|nr:hypothetical protein FC85_GL001797 [Lentilactobacillus diolivorans DSM 14421]
MKELADWNLADHRPNNMKKVCSEFEKFWIISLKESRRRVTSDKLMANNIWRTNL